MGTVGSIWNGRPATLLFSMAPGQLLLLSGTQFPSQKKREGSSRCGAVEMNPARNHEFAASIPGLDPWVKDPVLP